MNEILEVMTSHQHNRQLDVDINSSEHVAKVDHIMQDHTNLKLLDNKTDTFHFNVK